MICGGWQNSVSLNQEIRYHLLGRRLPLALWQERFLLWNVVFAVDEECSCQIETTKIVRTVSHFRPS
jgi:hypothetical protein